MTVNNGFRKVVTSKRKYTRRERTLFGLPAPTVLGLSAALDQLPLKTALKALRDQYRADVSAIADKSEIIRLHKRLDHLIRRVLRTKGPRLRAK